MKRIVLLEPNLIKPFGHVIEFPLALAAAAKTSNLKLILVANKNVTVEALQELPKANVIKGLSNSCFENLDTKGETFFNDLVLINQDLKLTSEDIILCTTSYTNQLYGAAKFLEQRNDLKINLWFHQIYAPQKEFSLLLNKKLKEKVEMDLINALAFVSNKNINIFTTESEKLYRFFKNNFRGPVKKMPLPFNEKYLRLVKSKSRIRYFYIGFLGDGRYEKGALNLMKSITDLKSTEGFEKLRFFLQIINPRGYSESEKTQFDLLKNELSKLTNVEFLDNSLSTDQYYELFRKLDLLVFPYHAKSYDKRVSAIFLQALCMGIPSIVSQKTWLAEKIYPYDLDVVFGKNNLSDMIFNTIQNYSQLKPRFVEISKIFRRENNANNFLSKLKNVNK